MKNAGPGRRNAIRSKIRTVASLGAQEVERMWSLFSEYYDDVSWETFLDDLQEKSHAVIMTVNGRIEGFTTILLYEQAIAGRKVRVLFSGDTVKNRMYWGDQSLQRRYVLFLFCQWARNPFKKFYWFLLSKGYKTYLLAVRNFPDVWPRRNKPTPLSERRVIDALAAARYGNAWAPERGVLHFPERKGKLKSHAAPLASHDLKDLDIAFFLEKNPGFVEGDELCCIAPVTPRLWLAQISKNALRATRKLRRKGGSRTHDKSQSEAAT